MSSPELQCLFCQQSSSKAAGLASHIRSRHPKQYQKWMKTPTRLADAQGAAEPKAVEQLGEPPVVAAVALEPPPSSPEAGEGNPTLDLLKQAHGQLLSRKQQIEADMARLADLTKELETVNTQIQALDKTLEVFEPGATTETLVDSHLQVE